ncbi:MAG: sigma-54-dependent Fis family transcriptional regulator [Myxococcales bacterium]|nr:sigma-54-dependent Fis family transcriptional regulator [Myxococcales bacterium]
MDESTLVTVDPSSTQGDEEPLTLTILVHPDARRLGQQCALEGRGRFAVSRNDARFAHPGGRAEPLADRHMSRRPIWITTDATITTIRSEAGKVLLGGAPLQGPGASVDADALARGVILDPSRNISLLIRRAARATVTDEMGMVGPSPELRALRSRLRRLADSELPVLVRGPTGSGKELVARAIHDHSRRASGPWVPVNLAAIPESTAASQFFGHARGAFTGARTSSQGLFGEACGGSLFLDECGELPDALQPMLLRALEAGEVQVVGGLARAVDVRIIAATDADLEQAIAAGRFRPALFHRLAGNTLTLTPLRERREDIAAQLRHFLLAALRRSGREARARDGWLAPALQRALVFHDWPGNTRQLARVVEGLVAESGDDARARLPEGLRLPAAPPSGAPPSRAAASTVAADGLEALTRALAAHAYRLTPTAKALGISVNTLRARMKQHGLRTAGELGREDIEATKRAVGDDVEALARALRVSVHGLRLRLRELE